MPTDFDTKLDRRDTDSLKWNRYSDPDLIPMWVADMDFAAPPAVLRALRERLDHGVLGYSQPSASLVNAVQEHLALEYDWNVASDWIVWLPGVVTGLNAACQAFAQGGPIATHTPIYPPFVTAPKHAGTDAFRVPLTVNDGRYELNLPVLEADLPETCRLLLLCNPENPGGSLHGREELERLLGVAEKHDLVVCSDEIHCGLVLDPERRHVPFASLNASAAERSIVLMAPSKTYNIPGLSCAFAIIPNPDIRHRFRQPTHGIVPEVNALGLVGCEAAYRDCREWHADLIAYLRGNRDILLERIAQMPGLKPTYPEATYLAWIDCRESGIEDPAGFFEKHGVGLADGSVYGSSGFVRLNFACPRVQLVEALDRMENGLRQR